MQSFLYNEIIDYSTQNVLIPISGGINSAAVLCVLARQAKLTKPKELHLFYIHFSEHSPDTFKFVKDLMRYAKRNFENVKLKITRTSVLSYFEKGNFIPHPTISPCSIELKVKPIEKYKLENSIDVELIGFVRGETKRVIRQQSKTVTNKQYPILHLSDGDCFSIVKSEIGWYPKIYDIKENGKAVFKHNNCLPCKNMTKNQFTTIGRYFPEYAQKAMETAKITNSYFGRDDVPDVFKCDRCERLD